MTDFHLPIEDAVRVVRAALIEDLGGLDGGGGVLAGHGSSLRFVLRVVGVHCMSLSSSVGPMETMRTGMPVIDRTCSAQTR